MPKLSATRLTKKVVDSAKAGQCLSDAEVRGFRLIVSPKGTKRFVVSYRKMDGKESMMALGPYCRLIQLRMHDRNTPLWLFDRTNSS